MGRIRGLIVITLLALLCAPAAARADLSWTAPPESCLPPNAAPAQGCGQQLSPAGEDSKNVHVATDAAGDAAAVWLEHDSRTNVETVEEARRSAGGNFGSPIAISAAQVANQNSDAADPTVAMNARGDVIVVWDQFDSSLDNGVGEQEMFYSWQPAGGNWAPVQVVLQGSVGGDTNPQVGLDSAGDAVLTWLSASSSTDAFRTLDASYRPAGNNSSWAARRSLTACPSCTSQNGTLPSAPQLAVDPAGDALIGFVDTYNPQDIDADDRVDAVFLPAGGPSGWPDFGHQTTLSVLNGGRADEPAVALDANGDGLVAFDQGLGHRAIMAAYRPKAQGSFTLPAPTISTTTFNSAPTVAFGPGGDAFALWSQVPDAQPPLPAQVVAAYRPAGAASAFGAAIQVSSGTSKADFPRVGVDGQDRPAALWVSTDSAGTETVLGSSRVSGSGAWATATPLSTPGTLDDDVDGEPDLSVSSAGQAVGVWQRSNGSEHIAESTVGTPPEVKPPPPPPPPPPPIPQAINAATPIQAGQAIVLTATVKNATHLVWDFGQGSPTIEAGMVGGALQTSVRLRPAYFERSLTVKVTATGPGGTNSYSRTLELPRYPTDAYSNAVSNALSSVHAPAVYGVGDAATLLGKTTCGPVTVYTGKQQMSGCLRPINVEADIPSRELGAIQAMASTLGLDPSDPKLLATAVQRIDGYVGPGTVTLNNTWPAVPSGGASLISFPGIGAMTSSNASLDIGGLKFGGLSGGFSLNVNPKLPDIPLGSLPKPSLPDIAGFPAVGNWNIDLGSGSALIDTSISLPSWLSIGGVPLHIPVRFRATPHGLELDGLDIGPFDANLGPLRLTGLHLSYNGSTDTWVGTAKVCLLTGLCLDMTPPRGEVKIIHGALNFAGATLDFPGPGVPLFTGVNMTNIGFGIGLDPTRLKSNAGITVVDLVQLQGTLVAGFPTADHPFVLYRDEVGNDFPADLYGKPFTEPTIGASADVGVNLPDIGGVVLGHGYLLYEVPDYIALGGGFDLNLKVIDLNGEIDGAANFSDHTVNLHADANACLLVIHKVCASAVVNVSRGPGGIGGAGGCLSVAGFSVGGGVQWNRITEPFIWPFDGCKWSRFKIDVRPTAAAASRRTMVVKRGGPNPALKIYGAGAAPLVRVTGPGGQQLDSTDSGFDHSPGGKIRILRYQGATGDFALVGLENARAGTYTVTALPGSAPFTTAESASDPPNAKVTATIRGSGEHRTLTYTIRRRPDQSVTFWDANARGAGARVLGKVNGGGHGTLHFTAAPGERRRTVYAQFTLAGIPAERVTVAAYRPPAPTLPRPRGLRVTRKSSKLTAGWKSVPGATGYEVTLTDPLTGYQRLTRTHRNRVVLTRLKSTVGGTLSVRAVEPRYARSSLTATAKVKRLASPSSKFRKLGKCKLGKAKQLSCKGGPPIKVKHRVAKPKPKPKAKR